MRSRPTRRRSPRPSTASPQVRRRARERALQFLFGLDFTAYDWRSVIEAFWTENPARPGVKRYAELLIEGVTDHRSELDGEIEHVLEKWAPQRVGRVERNLIRLALFEMRHCPDVPEKVAIDEAIEIAKRFGGDEAPRFINGILDRLRQGKD